VCPDPFSSLPTQIDYTQLTSFVFLHEGHFSPLCIDFLAAQSILSRHRLFKGYWRTQFNSENFHYDSDIFHYDFNLTENIRLFVPFKAAHYHSENFHSDFDIFHYDRENTEFN
jgi:hypothetical protein